ncbi:MAG: cupin domain-containing protein [Gemmatimonadaceae bacterium]|nr:cupin domain-containing protein [Gemmatimonadaceae bacterium]
MSTERDDIQFLRTSAVAWDRPAVGVRRQVLAHGADLMLVRVDFDTGAIGALHDHPHRQATYVVAGRFTVTVGGMEQSLGAGDSFFAPGGVPHAVLAHEPGTLLDAFSPARADFLPTTA